MDFHSTEFYVLAATVAAAVLALLGRRQKPGAAKQVLLATDLSFTGTDVDPSLELIAQDDGNVVFRRHGISGIGSGGAVSLAIEVRGFDVSITERVTLGPGNEIDTASTLLEFMGGEHYFISFRSDATDLSAAFTFHNRPGMHIIRPLK